MTKEEIFDTNIHPLMERVTELCYKHGIAMLAHFAVPGTLDDRIQVLMHCGDEKDRQPMNQLLALACLRPSEAATILKEENYQPNDTGMH